jgi:hypothetical protein
MAARPLSSRRRSELVRAAAGTNVLAMPAVVDERQGPIEAAEVVGSALTATRQSLLAWLFDVVEPTFDPPDEPSFDDVPRSHPGFVVVEWAAWEGLLSGYGDGTFRPDSSVAPRAAAAMAARARLLL